MSNEWDEKIWKEHNDDGDVGDDIDADADINKPPRTEWPMIEDELAESPFGHHVQPMPHGGMIDIPVSREFARLIRSGLTILPSLKKQEDGEALIAKILETWDLWAEYVRKISAE